jgi:SAM-dependent methyltransferase
MDLTQFHPTPQQVEEAARLLRYQPFVLDENRQTGVAYVWLHHYDPTKATPEDFFFDRRNVPEDLWNAACDANRRLTSMYDAFVTRIVEACPPGGSYLDVGCNTGYFPMRASLAGLGTAAGVDAGNFSRHVQLLNEITGSSAKFSVGFYDPATHALTMEDDFGIEQYDVVSACSFLCHFPDPLHFLKAISRLASKAVFLWSGFIDTEELLIRYNPTSFSGAEFPNGFDDGTSISLGLLFLSMSKLGFANHEELKSEPDWLPEDWTMRRIPQYQKFRAFIFWR